MTHQDNGHLEIEDRGAVLIVRVDGGPHSLFGLDIANELDELVDRVDRDPSVHAVVFTGAHPERFVSHADVRWLQEGGAAVPKLGRRGASAALRLARSMDRAGVLGPVVDRTPLRGAVQLDRLHATFMKMNASGVIFVAALNGSALGLGAEFAWACDLRVMADGDFFIGQPEVLLGIMPGGGGTQRLTRLIGTHKSLVAILEGKPFTPAQALANGAVDDVVPPDEVVARATELAEHFGSRTKGSVEAIKRSVYFGGSMSLAEGLHVERTEFLISGSVQGRSGTDARLPGDHRVHRRAAPLQPGHLRASARIGQGARRAARRTGGELAMTAAQPFTRHDVEPATGLSSRTAGGVPRKPTSQEKTVTVSSYIQGRTNPHRLRWRCGFAYRELGPKAGVPVIFLVHLAGNLDNWDPRVVDGIAARHRVITFDNRGVGASTGKTPATIQAMAKDAVTFIRALGFDQVDLHGFSMGGMIAQVIAQDEPELVRKLILTGTGPAGGKGMKEVVWVAQLDTLRGLLSRQDPKQFLFFTRTANGKREGKAFLARLQERTVDRDTPTTVSSYFAQLKACRRWGKEEPHDLSLIRQPVLLANGDNDRMLPTPNTLDMARRLPNNELVIYPDAGHGGIFQFHEQFVEKALEFLAK